MTKRLTKQQRRDWFYALTDQEREAWIAKKQAQKTKDRAGKPSNCPIFPVIDSSNRKEWQDKVLKMNDWLDKGVFA